jgi:hypothetical protein
MISTSAARGRKISPMWTEGDQLRAAVRGAIEEASQHPLSVQDPLPDELLHAAQLCGVSLNELRLFITRAANGANDWGPQAFVRWACEWGLIEEPEDTIELPVRCVRGSTSLARQKRDFKP